MGAKRLLEAPVEKFFGFFEDFFKKSSKWGLRQNLERVSEITRRSSLIGSRCGVLLMDYGGNGNARSGVSLWNSTFRFIAGLGI